MRYGMALQQQLFTCRSRLSIPKTLFMSLKELGILKTRHVRAGLSVKSKLVLYVVREGP